MVVDSLLLRREPMLVRLDELREHEDYDPQHLEELFAEITGDGVLRRPIIVDVNTNVILDGHHRYNCIKKLGKRCIPAYFVDYMRPEIVVLSWDGKPAVTKEQVIKAGLTGEKLPPRTSRHMVRLNTKLQHITYIEYEVHTKLEDIP
jgi:hypothetical protein